MRLAEALVVLACLAAGTFLLMHGHPVAGGWLVAAAVISVVL